MRDLCMHLTRLSVEIDQSEDRILGDLDSYKEECIMQRCGHWDKDRMRCSLNVIVLK